MSETKLDLTIRDRLIIPGILPKTGGLVTQRVCQDIKDKVKITQEEMDAVNMRDVRGPDGSSSVAWDTHKAEETGGAKVPIEQPVISVGFTKAEMMELSNAVAKLDKEKKVTPESLETCEKFFRPEGEEG